MRNRTLALAILALADLTLCSSAQADSVDSCLEAGANHDVDATISLCSLVIQSGGLPQPQLADVLKLRGLAFATVDQNLLAEQDLEKAIEAGSTDAETYNAHGALLELDDGGYHQRANADFNIALALNPNYPEAYANRAIVSEDLGRLDSAIADLSRAIDLRPDNVYYYVMRGNAYLMNGQDGAARIDLDRALAIEPNDRHALAARAAVLMHQNEEQKHSATALASSVLAQATTRQI